MACFVFAILPGLINALTMTAAAEQPIDLLDHPIARNGGNRNQNPCGNRHKSPNTDQSYIGELDFNSKACSPLSQLLELTRTQSGCTRAPQLKHFGP